MGSNAGSRRTLAGLKQRLQDAPRRTVVPFPRAATQPRSVDHIVDAMMACELSEDRVRVIRRLAPTAHLTVDDACRVLDLVTLYDAKVRAVHAMRLRITDPENWDNLTAGRFMPEETARSIRAMRPDRPTQDTEAEAEQAIATAIQRALVDAIITPAPSAVATEVDGDADELREEIKMQRELVALEREATELARERARLESPWWVRLLRWVFRIDRRRT